MDEVRSRECPGLPADWINAWLAAVGATVLVPGLRLSWTTDALPVARLEHTTEDPQKALIRAWPSPEQLKAMPVARNHPNCHHAIERQVPVEAFIERVRVAGRNPYAWTLSSTMTDLAVDQDRVSHGPFDAAGPGSTKWLHHRLMKTHSHVLDPVTQIPASLDGLSRPVLDNGLGFDIARIREGSKFIDPVVETLAFFGLALFPVRGDGIETRYPRPRQRGWRVGGMNGFAWPAWSQALERRGIDALLDAWHASWRYRKPADGNKRPWRPDGSMWDRLGIHAAWRSTRYQAASSREMNRGYGSRRLNPR